MSKFIFPIVILLGLIWWLSGKNKPFQNLEGFTDQEKVVLRRQLAAFIPFQVAVFVLWFLFDRGIKLSIPVWNLNISFAEASLLLLDLFFGYIAISAIKNRVCLLNDENEYKPSKGWTAVAAGVLILFVMFFLTTLSLFIGVDDMISTPFE